ncbi:NADH-quinone oxidoreductase chain C [Candidatus Hepatincola sp. Pdp]
MAVNMASYYIPSESQLEKLTKLAQHFNTAYNDVLIGESFINNDQLIIQIHKDNLLKFLEKLKITYGFQQLIDIIGVDYPAKVERFEVIYNLLNLSSNLRVMVKTFVGEQDYLESCSKLYTNSDWLEREIWDMFGIYFKNHKDLRRILTDFGFEGHPLRKDFPLVGFSEIYFDEISKNVAYKPVELDAEYRDYDYQNPWLKDIEVDTFKHLQEKDKVMKKLDD